MPGMTFVLLSFPKKQFTYLDHVLSSSAKNLYVGTVVEAQLAEWLLPTPEVRGSNPVIGKF